MSFTQQISKFSKTAQDKVQKARKGITFALFRSVVMDSPVDTGRFRGNWNLSVGEPDKTTEEKFDKQGSVKVVEIANGVMSTTGELPVFLTNSLPYAEALENGSSKQAPQGMVRKNIARFDGIVKDVSTKVRMGGKIE